MLGRKEAEEIIEKCMKQYEEKRNEQLLEAKL